MKMGNFHLQNTQTVGTDVSKAKSGSEVHNVPFFWCYLSSADLTSAIATIGISSFSFQLNGSVFILAIHLRCNNRDKIGIRLPSHNCYVGLILNCYVSWFIKNWESSFVMLCYLQNMCYLHDNCARLASLGQRLIQWIGLLVIQHLPVV